MKMIKLNNDYRLPQFGLGTFLMSADEVNEVIPEAIKIGYRLFDTAQMYHNEEAIGQALKKSGLAREEYYIVSKLMYHHSIKKTKELILKSLMDLQTDYIDLFLIHWPNHDDEVNIRTWQVLEEFYKQGTFKAIGVSNFTRYQLLKLLENTEIVPAVNQVEFHPGLTQVPLEKFLKEKNIKLMGYGPLMRGGIFNTPYLETLEETGKKHSLNAPQTAIAWGLNRGVIMIPKTVTKERLIENFQAQNITLTKAEINAINSLNRGKRIYTDPANTIHNILTDD